jgi:LPXTG-motif cell wall-anchored protein
MSAASKNANVFEGSDSYTVVVTATGYNKPLEFTVKAVAQTTTTTAVTTTVQSTTTAKTTTTAKKTSSSPATGDSGAAIPAMMLALAGISAFIFKKKHK